MSRIALLLALGYDGDFTVETGLHGPAQYRGSELAAHYLDTVLALCSK